MKIFDDVNYSFFGRDSGFSEGLFSSLNCSKFVGDDRNVVEKNLEFVKNSVGAKKLLTLNQIHSAKCIIVDDKSESDQEADAMVTQSYGIALGILTADCVPVLFFDPKNKIIGAAHAGWKGAKAGVIENTIEQMVFLGSCRDDIVSAIGPCIHVKSYGVEKDFLVNFPFKYFSKTDEKNHFDIVKFCRDVLEKNGISKVSIVDIDTYRDYEKYFSYRYARQNSDGICGRNISVICMKAAG